MRFVLVAALGLAACATASPTPTAQAGCSPATTSPGTVVYASPDGTSEQVARLSSGGQVCADSDAIGFGYRHVKLANGKEGYVAEGDFI